MGRIASTGDKMIEILIILYVTVAITMYGLLLANKDKYNINITLRILLSILWLPSFFLMSKIK